MVIYTYIFSSRLLLHLSKEFSTLDSFLFSYYILITLLMSQHWIGWGRWDRLDFTALHRRQVGTHLGQEATLQFPLPFDASSTVASLPRWHLTSFFPFASKFPAVMIRLVSGGAYKNLFIFAFHIGFNISHTGKDSIARRLCLIL